MQMALHKLGYYRIILGREVEPHQLVEKNKLLNLLDESFDYLCTCISRDLLFHIEGLKTPREAWEKLEDLFGKQDELRGHLLENESVALHPNNFKTIEQFFTKFKSLALQCIKCGIEIKDDKNALSIISKLSPEYYVFVSIFHSKMDSFLVWIFLHLIPFLSP